MAIVGGSEVEIRPNVDKFEGEAESGVNKALGGLEGITGKIGLAAGAAGAIGLGAAFSESLDIGAGRAKMQAQLGLSKEDAATVGAAAGHVFSQNYGDNMEEVNDAVSSVRTSIQGMSTASQGDLEAASIKAINFSKIFGMDIPESAALAGNVIKSGLAKDSTQAFDLITVAMQKVPAAMRGDLTDAVSEYGTYLHGLGFTGEQAFGVLTNASAGGAIQLDKAGDALKEFSIRSTDMSSTSVAAYQTLGINARSSADDVLAGGDRAQGALKDVAAKLQGIKDPATQANTAIALFGTPLEDIGVAKIPQFLDGLAKGTQSLGDVKGAADNAGTAFNDNAKQNMEAFARGIQTGVVNAISNNAIPALNSVIGTLQSNGIVWDATKVVIVAALTAMGIAATINFARMAIGWVTTAATTVIGAATTVAGWVSTAAAAVASGATTAAIYALYVAGWIANGASAVAGAAVTVASWVATGAAAVGGFIASIPAFIGIAAGWVATGASAVAGAAVIAGAWLISIWPIALVIAAVVGVAILIVKNWDTIKDAAGAAAGFMADAWGKIKSAFSTGVDAVIGFVKSLPGKIKDIFIDAPQQLIGAGGDMIGGFIVGLKNKAGDLINAIKTTITDKLPGFVKDALGIHSPSKVFEDLGSNTMQGYINGIRGKAGAAQGAVADAMGFGGIGGIGSPNFASVGASGGSNNAMALQVSIQAPGANQDTVAMLRAVARDEIGGALTKMVTKTRSGAQ